MTVVAAFAISSCGQQQTSTGADVAFSPADGDDAFSPDEYVEWVGAKGEVAELLKAELLANEGCRGGNIDDPIVRSACDEKSALDKKLEERGWCFIDDERSQTPYWGICDPITKPVAVIDTSAAKPSGPPELVAFEEMTKSLVESELLADAAVACGARDQAWRRWADVAINLGLSQRMKVYPIKESDAPKYAAWKIAYGRSKAYKFTDCDLLDKRKLEALDLNIVASGGRLDGRF
ncbi:MAG: hypothetical protein ABI668_13045 [Sphingorhabdus sp.]